MGFGPGFGDTLPTQKQQFRPTRSACPWTGLAATGKDARGAADVIVLLPASNAGAFAAHLPCAGEEFEKGSSLSFPPPSGGGGSEPRQRGDDGGGCSVMRWPISKEPPPPFGHLPPEGGGKRRRNFESSFSPARGRGPCRRRGGGGQSKKAGLQPNLSIRPLRNRSEPTAASAHASSRDFLSPRTSVRHAPRASQPLSAPSPARPCSPCRKSARP